MRLALAALALARAAALRVRQRPTKVVMLMSDTGGGHRASARAITEALERQRRGRVDVEFMDIWAESGVFPWNSAPQAYKILGSKPAAWRALWYGSAFYPVHLFTRLLHDFTLRRRFQRLLQKAAPDLVVSVHPMCQHVPLTARAWLERAKGRKVPFATVVTDLGSAHPMWFDHRVDACFVPTQRLAKLSQHHGVAPGQVKNHGLPLRKAFRGRRLPPALATPRRRRAARRRARRVLGLPEARPTVLVAGGGDGFGGLEATVDAVAAELSRQARATGSPATVCVVCGRNAAVRRRLLARDWAGEHPGLSVVIKGFVGDMETWLGAADVLLTKAGPGTIAEAAALGVPVLLTGFLPGQERGNVLWVAEKKIGELATRPREAARTVAAWLADPERLDAMGRNALAAAKPRATDDIARDLWRLVDGRPVRAAAAA